MKLAIPVSDARLLDSPPQLIENSSLNPTTRQPTCTPFQPKQDDGKEEMVEDRLLRAGLRRGKSEKMDITECRPSGDHKASLRRTQAHSANHVRFDSRTRPVVCPKSECERQTFTSVLLIRNMWLPRWHVVGKTVDTQCGVPTGRRMAKYVLGTLKNQPDYVTSRMSRRTVRRTNAPGHSSPKPFPSFINGKRKRSPSLC